MIGFVYLCDICRKEMETETRLVHGKRVTVVKAVKPKEYDVSAACDCLCSDCAKAIDRAIIELRRRATQKVCPACNHGQENDFNFCPNCGAKMDGGAT